MLYTIFNERSKANKWLPPEANTLPIVSQLKSILIDGGGEKYKIALVFLNLQGLILLETFIS